jgi:hypothetical protein
VTRQAALAAGHLRFLARPLVRCALLVRGATAFAGNLTLPGAIHRRETAIFGSHGEPPAKSVQRGLQTIALKYAGKCCRARQRLARLSALAV